MPQSGKAVRELSPPLDLVRAGLTLVSVHLGAAGHVVMGRQHHFALLSDATWRILLVPARSL